MTRGWTKTDWRAKPRIQMPDYPDAAAVKAVEGQLAKYPRSSLLAKPAS